MALLDEAAEILGEESKAKPRTSKPTATSGFADLRATLAKRLKKGEQYFTIKNSTPRLFHIDWSLNLLPPDIKAETPKYFEEKYVQYAGEKFIPGVSFLVVKTQDNRTVSLLDNFVVEKSIPTMMPLPVGKDVVMKSQFVIGEDETVLVNEEQKDELQRYLKYKREWSDDTGKVRSSDWLGFLIAKQVTPENVKMIEFDRPVLSREDLSLAIASAAPEIRSQKEFRQGDVVYADE